MAGEHQAGLAAVIADQLQRTVDVVGRFRVEGDDVGAGFGEVRDDAVDRLDHQVHVDRHLHVRADRLAYQRADRQVRYVMVVHHVEVDNVGAGGDDVAHFFTEAGEIGGQDAGSDAEGGHG